MAASFYSADHIDYLQRGLDAPDMPSLGANVGFATEAPVAQRRLFRVRGIGRTDKANRRDGARPLRGGRFGTEELIIGLYGLGLPLVWRVVGYPGGVGIDVGTWAEERGASAHQEGVLEALLRSAFASVLLSPLAAEDTAMAAQPLGGLVLGVPAAIALDPAEGLAPWDRIIRGLAGAKWQALVVATPMPSRDVLAVRNGLLDELRAVRVQTRSGGLPDPVADQYGTLLEGALADASAATAEGGWRTGAYLLGDSEGYRRLASLWQGICSGSRAGAAAQPVRVRSSLDVRVWAARWGLPDIPPAEGPGRFRHPFRPADDVALLAACRLCPPATPRNRWVCGGREVPSFDVVPADHSRLAGSASAATDRAIDVGAVVENDQPGVLRYRAPLDDLTRHAFVAGATGSGKTNTIFHLLKQADESDVPFLVLEPAKTEYRALLGRPGWRVPLQVFTLGNELAAPLRLNPFEVPDGAPVAVHIDMLRSVFDASFGLWDPLPQVLERCLHGVYEDRGWDIAYNRNLRHSGGNPPSEAFPTLSDLAAKVDEVVRSLGYGAEVEGNVRTALLTRINGLRAGGKGRLLDVERSVSMASLLSRSTVLELEGLGDDDDRAFVMGLFFIRVVEHWRASGITEGLRHIFIIEEAHRLLAARGGGAGGGGASQQAGVGDPRGKAVEAFANMLAEIRAYGQGLIVADQIPTKLAPEVIKNTNLKIAHRIVDAEDRTAMGGAMAMGEAQVRSLATLPRGRAAVFSEGDDAPLLVQVPRAKGGPDQPSVPTDATVREALVALEGTQGHSQYLARHPECRDPDPGGRVCDAMRRSLDDIAVCRDVSRLVLSTAVNMRAFPGRFRTLWRQLEPRLRPEAGEYSVTAMAPIAQRCFAYHAAAWFARHRGAQAGWSFADAEALAAAMERALTLDERGNAMTQDVEAFRVTLAHLDAGAGPGCAACDFVHQTPAASCPFWHATADEVRWNSPLRAAWNAAIAADRGRGTTRSATKKVAYIAAAALLDFSDAASPDWDESEERDINSALQRAGLCFAHRMLIAEVDYAPGPALIELGAIVREF